MKKHFSMLASALIAAGTFSAPAFAADHYVSGNVGISWINEVGAVSGPHLETDSGINLLAAIGCDYGNYRLEAEAGYQHNDFKTSGAIKVLSLLGNGYYTVDAGGVKPYITAGVGLADVRLRDIRLGTPFRYSDSEATFAYQIGAGVEIPIARQVMLDARYRYFGTTEFTTGITGNESIDSNSVLVGLRMNF
ncbi:MAG TPA: outer membrane beta-barrel protein [Chlorobaculum sp.]|nr:outer membrane beta-barrel protein [Chlorobaculum sp.]